MSIYDATDIHEAGHGVMALLVGLRPRYITNIADETTRGRMFWAEGQRAQFNITRQIAFSDARAYALVYVAGTAAVREILAANEALRGVDDAAARSHARSFSSNEDDAVFALIRDAQDVFADTHVRHATIAVAARLAREHIVSGDDIEQRLRDVGLTEVQPLQFPKRTEPRRRTAVIGSNAFVDAASPHYFFSDRRRS